jgi:hypothetical protein
LIVPGLRDHVPGHWQTLLASRLPRVRTVAATVSTVRAFSQLGSSELRKISFLAVKKLDELIAAAGNFKAGSDGAEATESKQTQRFPCQGG